MEPITVHVPLQATYLKGSAAAVTFSSKEYFQEPEDPVKLDKTRGAVPWGTDNDLPQQIVELVEANPIATPSLEHKIDVAYGAGVKFGYLDDDNEFKEASKAEKQSKYKEVQQFFSDNDITGMYSELLTDLIWFYNGFIEIILNRENPGSRKIVSISCKEAFFSRWESANEKTGIVENHFYSSKWPEKPKKEEYTSTPVLWSKNPTRELAVAMGREKSLDGKTKDEKKFRYIIPVKMPYPGRSYYPKPYWYSIIKSGWLEFANKIPEFKKAYMLNSLTVAYHVEINEKYFPSIFNKEGIKAKKDQEKRIKKEYEDINKFLKGAENAGKTMITYYRATPDGKVEVSDIKIHVIDKKIGGEYLEDSHEASAMIAYAMRVHPSLIGVIPGKTTSNLSGSDKRELLRIQQTMQKRIRDKVLRPLYLVKKINKWPEEIEFSIPDLFLTTIDQGKEVDKSAEV